MFELLDDYYLHLRVRNYSEETIATHGFQLKLLCAFALTKDVHDLTTVTKAHIRLFQVHLYERVNSRGKRSSAQSQNNTLRVVRVFYRWLLSEERISVDPCKEVIYAKEPKTLPMLPPTTTEARQLLRGIDGESRLGRRDELLLHIFYGSALRAGELRRLKIEDCDIAAKTIRVNLGKYGRTRIVPMTEVCRDLLKRYLKDIRPQLVQGHADTDEGYLFVSLKQARIGRSLPGLVVKNAAKVAKLTKRLHPHVLRAACLTHMLRGSKQAGRNILRPLMEMAGHSDLTTLHRYTATDITELKEIHSLTHPLELEPR